MTRIHGIITKGGSAVNVIPDQTEAVYNIRSNRMADARPLAEPEHLEKIRKEFDEEVRPQLEK